MFNSDFGTSQFFFTMDNFVKRPAIVHLFKPAWWLGVHKKIDEKDFGIDVCIYLT